MRFATLFTTVTLGLFAAAAPLATRQANNSPLALPGVPSVGSLPVVGGLLNDLPVVGSPENFDGTHPVSAVVGDVFKMVNPLMKTGLGPKAQNV
ncbi:hypothetical protein BOTBODRAFT_177155 [Botryobasidium botryosum FD-172 SS1]|uniref:Uncharacterized protein n=1 Tax=Botryobasidium botryosum (strain FD-172 SS1) TaxID=930990 RepID=A0A067M7J9_BOTB1|nr:hypothetical protein BOTBODRAFT_177155 [Botryobasidium botryosum FD-172 SS1]